MNKLVEKARVFVLLAGNPMGVVVPLAVYPSLTQIAAHFSRTGPSAFDSASIAQLVMTISALTMVIGSPLLGALAGWIGKRPIFLGSALTYGIAGIAGVFAPDLWTLLVSRLLLGLASAGLGATAIGFMGEYFPRERRDRLIGWNGFLIGAVALLTLLAAGKLAEIDWRAPFGLYVIGLIVFAIAVPVLGETKSDIAAANLEEGGSIRGALRLFALTLVTSIIVVMITVQGPFLLASKGENSPSVMALIGIVSQIGVMIGAYSFNFLRPRIPFFAIMSIFLAALGAGTVGLGLSGNVAAWTGFAALSGLGAGLVAPLMQSAILNAVSPSAGTRAMGVTLGCMFSGQFLNVPLLTPVRSVFGIEAAFVFVGGLAIVGSAFAGLRYLMTNSRDTAGLTRGSSSAIH